MRGDFRVHTIYSDGAYTTREILELAQDLDYIAITDHDTFSGAKEIFKFNFSSLKIIFGIELSTDFNGESIHLLGYFPAPETTNILEEKLNEQQQHRIKRAQAILDKLREHFNIHLDFSSLLTSDSITRGLIAETIIKQGYPYTREKIFDKMLGAGCPAYIPSTKLSTKEGIKLIKKARGYVFLAHPALLVKTNIEDILAMDIDGIEAIHPSNKRGDEESFRRLARNNNIIISAGSDFHEFNDGMHGAIGEYYLTGPDLECFLGLVKSLR